MSEMNTNGIQGAEEAVEATTEAFKKVEADMTKLFEGVDMAVPEAFRSFAEQSVAQSREAYEKAKDAMEEAVEVLEKSIDKAGQGTAAFNRKMIDITQANLNSGFDLAKNLAGAKNITEIMELQSAFFRSQFETLAKQAEEVRDLTTKIATDTTDPIKDHVSRSIDKVKAN
jgi:phasin